MAELRIPRGSTRAEVLRARDEYVRKLYRDGETRAVVRRQTANVFGAAPRNDRLAQLRSQALPIRTSPTGRSRVTAGQRNAARTLRQTGASNREIARALGISPDAVRTLQRSGGGPKLVQGRSDYPGGVSIAQRSLRHQPFATRNPGPGIPRYIYEVRYRTPDRMFLDIRVRSERPLRRSQVLQDARGRTAGVVRAARNRRGGPSDESIETYNRLKRQGKLGTAKTRGLEFAVEAAQAVARQEDKDLPLDAGRYTIVDAYIRDIVAV